MHNLERTSAFSPEPADEPAALALPQRIGRYRIERLLGQGGFGQMFLAHDEQLSRPVAIKVPHRKLVSCPEDAAVYLAEARTVAALDHPHIVPVYDVGSSDDHSCYVVSKYIEGRTLAQYLKENRPSCAEAAELVATVAEALHYAHRKGLVHRDVKPANILLDTSGKPFVVDFGLALHEEHRGQGVRYAGTPAYMSPEQARGEGHRVDGRSDLFSLGVVFYELLTGRRPFQADYRAELLEQIASVEARPPRQWDDTIPKEVERICLKVLSKRAADRYTTAKDMADDLSDFLASSAASSPPVVARSPAVVARSPDRATGPDRRSPETPGDLRSSPVGRSGDRPTTQATPTADPGTTPAADSESLRIVPKGLRSFDAHDADFFLALLPGPRDREGLPDSLRFWKTRIEEADADSTFSVGLIYGPSGCGKSSLVKAGLLPRLSEMVVAVYVEATAAETELRLLNGLRKRCPVLPADLGLKETLAVLRRGQALSGGQKVLIVLDQFEQWLHANKDEDPTELVQALRQCDGGRVQCVVLVRDDFWMAVTRFLRALEIRLVEGQNSAAVDLFPPRHAEKVLAAFGRAFGALPENSNDIRPEQQRFLEQAVQGLAQDGKVISVRLALFAEMMKGKAWTPAALQQVGGIEGVGATFLEETFSAATAPPQHRYHQNAARAVLKALLPEAGTNIKGVMRSHTELQAASGYGKRPGEFDDLLRILDGEVRLLTPTDPEGADLQARSASEGDANPSLALRAGDDKRCYQLTHDYLVPSLHDWLTRKQKETRRGRAELLLADRAAIWNARSENRQLPSLWQWLQIRWLTAMTTWTPPQRNMMRQATRYHASQTAVAAVLLAVVVVTGLFLRAQVAERTNATRAAGLVQSLLNADTAQVPALVGEMAAYRKWMDPLLRAENDKAGAKSRQKLHTSLALLPVDVTQVDYLHGRLLDAEPREVPVIRDALAAHQEKLREPLWAVVEAPEPGKERQRLRAAAALAKYDPNSENWAKYAPLVVADLVQENTVYLGQWSEAFRPVKNALLNPLADIYRDQRPERAAERALATNLLADYAADQPRVVADLLMDANEKQFAALYPKFKEQAEQGLPMLSDEIDRKLPPDAKDDAKEKLAKRQANAAVALLRLNHPAKVWPVLKHSPDPRVRSYLIHRLAPLGADSSAVIQRLDEEPDLTIRRALLLSLGEYAEKDLPSAARDPLLAKVQKMYRTDADPGLHAAAEWLLRQWKQEAWLKQVNDDWAKDRERRDRASRAALAPGATPQWYVNGQGQTLVLIPGPVEFLMGSPPTEADRYNNEVQHRRRICRSFALAAKPVTVSEYRRFNPKYTFTERYAPTADCPVISTDWYQAAAYCNWLSKQEDIPEDQWCYETNAQGIVTRLKENYLSLTGYRLPTEAEIEYATRAGTVTARSYGETAELLGNYNWYFENAQERSWPPGSKKPNDLGLFDLHGNVYTWCQESYKLYTGDKKGEVIEDKEDVLNIVSETSRVSRGGSFYNRTSNGRSSYRFVNLPSVRNYAVGLRPARTLPP